MAIRKVISRSIEDNTVAATDFQGAVTSLSNAGNLTFSSTGQRILGDFSNADLANRVNFQTSTTNGATAISAIPNGTSTTARVNLLNTTDTTNYSLGTLLISSTAVRLGSDAAGTGTYLPLTMYTGGSERVRIDTSGNVGIGTASPGSKLNIGVTDSTAYSAASSTGQSGVGATIQVTNLATAANAVSQILFNMNNDRVINRIVSSYDSTTDGYLAFVTEGAGTPAERMRIDASGRVTMPYQPAFMAGATTGSQTITTGTQNVVQLNTTKYNVGSHYNTSTYTFTAPVAGLYAFKMYTTIITATNNAITGGSDFQCKLYINGADYGIGNGDYGGNPVGYFAASTRLVFAVLAAGDTATSNIFQSTGSSQTLQLAMCNFSGYLVR